MLPAVKKRRTRRPDNGSYWTSFSDMLSSVLLVIMLALVFSIYQYYSQLDIKTKELEAQKSELDRTLLLLTTQQQELDNARIVLVGKEDELAAIQIQLDAQKDDLENAQALLLSKEQEQALLQLQLSKQQEALAAQEGRLVGMQDLLNTQQRQLDDLLGLRTEIVQELSSSLAAANLAAKVDPGTGDIILDSQLMFETGLNTISYSGQVQLAQLIPVYLNVLMRPEYVDYVAEIIIEGHTDSKGSYIFNLELSQDRALSVATYCLQLPGLTAAQRELLQNILTSKGRSYSDLIYNPDGTENMDASRRVELKFRLKDTEMIQRMNEILSESAAP